MPVNQGVAPPDFDSEVGSVRLLIGDTDPSNVEAGKGEYLWYSDAELRALIKLKSSVERAAIHVLRIVALTPAMQLKKWSEAELSIDGAAITRALNETIRDIEKSIDSADAEQGSDIFRIVDTWPRRAPDPYRSII